MIFTSIIKELANEFRSNMQCLGENTEKYISFCLPLEGRNNEGKVTVYRIKFIDSMRFMKLSLANLTDNLVEINTMDCKTCWERNKVISTCYHIANGNNRLIYICEKCNSKSYKPINSIKEKFPETYSKFGDGIDKFTLLLRKGVYPYEYMDSWERFNEKILPPKK